MNRKTFLRQLSLSLLATLYSNKIFPANMNTSVYQLQLWRNATLYLRMGKYQFLIDPMLSAKGEMDPVKNAGNDIRIPMVDLPLNHDRIEKTINRVDAIILTHLHRDHWDQTAIGLIPKEKLILCQASDIHALREQGFINVRAIDQAQLPDIIMVRIGGQHGTGEIGKLMGTVSGVMIKHEQKTIYIAGDTIYCHEVEQAVLQYQPDVIICNAGGAQFLNGGPIIMNEHDVEKVLNLTEKAKVITVHLEAVNHCFTTREVLKKHFEQHPAKNRLIIPDDGDYLTL